MFKNQYVSPTTGVPPLCNVPTVYPSGIIVTHALHVSHTN